VAKNRIWSEKIFKAYDIRGVCPDEINEDAAYKIARAPARYLVLGKENKTGLKIILSAGARPSSPAMKACTIGRRGSFKNPAKLTSPQEIMQLNSFGECAAEEIEELVN